MPGGQLAASAALQAACCHPRLAPQARYRLPPASCAPACTAPPAWHARTREGGRAEKHADGREGGTGAAGRMRMRTLAAAASGVCCFTYHISYNVLVCSADACHHRGWCCETRRSGDLVTKLDLGCNLILVQSLAVGATSVE